MRQKHELPDDFPDQLRQALQATADTDPDTVRIVTTARTYTARDICEEVERQTDFGKDYAQGMETIARDIGAAELFSRMYRDVRRMKMAQKAGLEPQDETYLLFESVYPFGDTAEETREPSTKYEFKGALLDEFKGALRELSNARLCLVMAHTSEALYTLSDIYKAVAEQTEFGAKFTKSMEARCNFDERFTPQVLFEQMRAYAGRIRPKPQPNC